jgi:hypothetical protein
MRQIGRRIHDPSTARIVVCDARNSMSEQQEPITRRRIGGLGEKPRVPWVVCVIGLAIAALALAYGYYGNQPQGNVVSLSTKTLSIAGSVDTRNGLDGTGLHSPSKLLNEGN